MRSFGIVKLNIGSYTGLKCSIGRMIFPVEFFFFQRCEEWFCDRVIMRLAGLRKGLLRIVFMQKLLKPVRGILRSTVAMKNKTRWGMAFFMRHFKCCSEKLGAVLFWNLMCDHFAWEKVDDKLHTPCMDLNVPTRMDGAFCFDCKRRKHTQTGGTERFSVKFAAAPPCLWWAEWRIDCSFLQNNQRSVAAHSTSKEKIQIPVERCVVQRTFVCEAWAAYKGIFLKWEGIIEKSTNRFPVKVNDIVRFP